MPRARSVFHRLAPKGPTRVEHQLCPECGCCTLPPAGDDVHWYNAPSDERTCWCSNGPRGPRELRTIVEDRDEDFGFDEDGWFPDDEDLDA